jgi:hypothetical protein
VLQVGLPFGTTPGNPFPAHAIIGGYEADGTPLYICQARYQGGMHPGKTHHDWGSCHIAWGGGEIPVTDTFEVLVPFMVAPGPGMQMQQVSTASDGSPIGICTANYAGSTQVGQLLHNVCSFGFAGGEVDLTSGYNMFGQPVF